ncbi:MAG: hypothetical protein AVDCRST_MAG57-1354 [uncultured Blastococcus sp.]|uniref:Uncharacterized protein n=1 Tax=uncultured Blastococcus sp. TaxID=217144 RepID=A0A6J4HZ40_9ACTN|nr:MAG: hypothetical protein AVDCRST_MAG57-1354 [uncultured Blastococcus sp.]
MIGVCPVGWLCSGMRLPRRRRPPWWRPLDLSGSLPEQRQARTRGTPGERPGRRGSEGPRGAPEAESVGAHIASARGKQRPRPERSYVVIVLVRADTVRLPAGEEHQRSAPALADGAPTRAGHSRSDPNAVAAGLELCPESAAI